MKLPFILLCLGVTARSVLAESSDATTQLPNCAATCLSSAVIHSTCSPINQTCICTSTDLTKAVQGCVFDSCTQKQALTAMNITSTTCGAPFRDRSGQFNAISLSLGISADALIIIRISYQHFSTATSLGWDDWFIIATIFGGIPATIINSAGLVPSGLGKDVWTVSFDSLTAFGRWFYINEILYFAQIALLNTSVLFFYLRIFGHTRLKLFLIYTLVFNALYGVLFVFLAVFQCHPISYYWTKWDNEYEGICLDPITIVWANAGIRIALDFWMLALPLSQIRSLNLHWKKKSGVVMMFCVGTFATAASIIRLQSLVLFARPNNPTWEHYDVAIWSTIEINVGIICACMPAVRLVLVCFFPCILGSATQRSSHSGVQYGHGKSSGGNGGSGSRILGSESVVGTVNREDRTRATSSKGIMLPRDVTVEYHDETSLVDMQDIHQLSMKDGGSRAS